LGEHIDTGLFMIDILHPYYCLWLSLMRKGLQLFCEECCTQARFEQGNVWTHASYSSDAGCFLLVESCLYFVSGLEINF